MCCEISAVGVRVDVETAVGITAPIDAHSIEWRIERVAGGCCEHDGRLRFFAVAVWVGEDPDGLEGYLC